MTSSALPNHSTARRIIRPNGEWAEEKLTFLDRYVGPALNATRRKPGRHYIDLFAGPGLWHEREGAAVRDGAALRMVAAEGTTPETAFTHATFVNLSGDHDRSLRGLVGERISAGRCRIPPSNLKFVNDDANAVVARILAGVGRYDYALVVADFENPSQWPWESVEAVREYGPESTELYLMMPTHMHLLRMIARDHRKSMICRRGLNTFFGCEDWVPLVKAVRNDRERRQMALDLEKLYMSRLRYLGWKHVNVVRKTRRRGAQRLYSMIFATDHKLGKKFVEWELETKPRLQLALGLDF